MMTFTNAGVRYAMSVFAGLEPALELWLRLFGNDLTPTRVMTASDLQEVRGGGYEPQKLSAAAFDGAGTSLVFPPVTFTFGGKVGLVYGAFLTAGLAGVVIAAGRFDDARAPYDVQLPGDFVRVKPALQWYADDETN